VDCRGHGDSWHRIEFVKNIGVYDAIKNTFICITDKKNKQKEDDKQKEEDKEKEKRQRKRKRQRKKKGKGWTDT
jgi:hypothetical protein